MKVHCTCLRCAGLGRADAAAGPSGRVPGSDEVPHPNRAIPVGKSPTEVAALLAGLGSHRRRHPAPGALQLTSRGGVGDGLDNALAETTIGLYKTECIRDDSPFRHGPLTTLADVEEITSAWVHWYNTQRLMHHLGRVAPADAENTYYATAQTVEKTITHTN